MLKHVGPEGDCLLFTTPPPIAYGSTGGKYICVSKHNAGHIKRRNYKTTRKKSCEYFMSFFIFTSSLKNN